MCVNALGIIYATLLISTALIFIYLLYQSHGRHYYVDCLSDKSLQMGRKLDVTDFFLINQPNMYCVSIRVRLNYVS